MNLSMFHPSVSNTIRNPGKRKSLGVSFVWRFSFATCQVHTDHDQFFRNFINRLSCFYNKLIVPII